MSTSAVTPDEPQEASVSMKVFFTSAFRYQPPPIESVDAGLQREAEGVIEVDLGVAETGAAVALAEEVNVLHAGADVGLERAEIVEVILQCQSGREHPEIS